MLKRRIESARILRNISQAELSRRCARDGLDKLAAARAERGEVPFTRVLREAFARHLAVPEWWFTAAEVTLPAKMPRDPQAAVIAFETAEAVLTLLRDHDKSPEMRVAYDRLAAGMQTAPAPPEGGDLVPPDVDDPNLSEPPGAAPGSIDRDAS